MDPTSVAGPISGDSGLVSLNGVTAGARWKVTANTPRHEELCAEHIISVPVFKQTEHLTILDRRVAKVRPYSTALAAPVSSPRE